MPDNKDDEPIEELFNEDEESNIDYSIFDDQIKLKELNEKHSFIKDYFGKPMITTYVHSDTYNRKTIRFITPESFAMIYCNQYIEIRVGKTPKTLELGKWWIKNGKRREYETIMFDPTKGQDDKEMFNLWEGLNCVPAKGTWKQMKKHIWEILCNKDKKKFKYTMKWFAWSVQNPDKRAEAAMVFKGKQGAGKGVVLSQFVHIFGNHGMQIANREHLTGKFTGHLKLVVFLYADEAYYPGDKEVEGTLKNLITEEVVMREAKFQSPTLEKNRLHIVMSTNNEWIIPAGLDSRRFFINEVSNKYAMNETDNMTRSVYFNKLWKEMDNGGREAMLYDLLNVKLDNWHPREDIPITEELKRQQQMSLSKTHKAIKELLELGEFPGQYTTANQYEIQGSELYEFLDKIYPDAKKIGVQPKSNMIKQLGAFRVRTSKGSVWIFPTLREMRVRWNEQYPKEIWDLTEEWIVRKSEY